MKEYAKKFYKSSAWRNCRDSYMHSVGGLCERCIKQGIYVPAEIVHHKIYISQDNINEPSITLNWENLEAVCRECHAQEHELGHRIKRRYSVDDFGKVVIVDN